MGGTVLICIEILSEFFRRIAETMRYFFRRRSQGGRQESAKLLFTGSIPVVASSFAGQELSQAAITLENILRVANADIISYS